MSNPPGRLGALGQATGLGADDTQQSRELLIRLSTIALNGESRPLRAALAQGGDGG
jgi:hypothetical protein